MHPGFEVMSKRRKGYPSETNVKRGLRSVRGGEKELVEKLGRHDPCPCGSGRRFAKCCMTGGRFRWGGAEGLLAVRGVPIGLAPIGRDLAGAVLELPRRIGEDRPEPPPPRGADQIKMRGERVVRGEHMGIRIFGLPKRRKRQIR